MHTYKDLLQNNKDWVAQKLQESPHFFANLAKGQNPPFLLIGCSDSRKPLDTITKAEPGELLIHRNIGNQVSLTDMNLLSVLEFGVEVLKVQHVIVCGHFGCGGIHSALTGKAPGLVENWTIAVKDLYLKHKESLDQISDFNDRMDKLAEINVVHQIKNLCKTSILHKAFLAGHYPLLHGWVFDIYSGHVHELKLPLKKWKNYGLLPPDYPE